MPEDLRAALDAAPAAASLLAEPDDTNRSAIRFRVGNVERAETRACGIDESVVTLARGETLCPRRAKRG